MIRNVGACRGGAWRGDFVDGILKGRVLSFLVIGHGWDVKGRVTCLGYRDN